MSQNLEKIIFFIVSTSLNSFTTYKLRQTTILKVFEVGTDFCFNCNISNAILRGLFCKESVRNVKTSPKPRAQMSTQDIADKHNVS